MKAMKLAWVGVVLAAAACATGRPTSGNPYGSAEDAEEIRIEIQNFNFSDVTVWALVRDGARRRLGVVGGKSDAAFTVDWTFSEPLRLEFDFVAGPRCTTESLVTDPGDIIELQIANEYAQMSDWCH